MTFRSKAITMAVGIAFAAGAPLAFGQQPQQQQGQQPQGSARAMPSWNLQDVYSNSWSARRLIDTEARGAQGEKIGEIQDIIVDRNGRISKVVIEAGGFMNIGDNHYGVRWDQLRIGPNMSWVQVPLREENVGGFSLFTGEDVAQQPASWRVNELIGDYVSLQDAPRYGLVVDVLFDEQGQAKGVVVDRARGAWGDRGRYAYPWTGVYDRSAATYPLPYRGADVGRYERFDYVELGKLSRFGGPAEPRGRSARAEESPRAGARR